MSPEPDDYLEEEEPEEYGQRSIFSAGWFRAVLVLTVLAIVVVVSLPYLLNWFEPSTPPTGKPAPRTAEQAPKPPPPSEAPSTIIPLPPAATAPAPVRPETARPAAQAPGLPPAKPAPGKAPAPAPAAQAQPEPPKPLLKPAAKPAETARRPERVAAVPPKPEGARAETTGGYWVQVGLFKEARNAQGFAKTLRDEGFQVDVASVTRGGSRPTGARPHELFVTGASVEAVNAALKGRGVAQSTTGGVSVRPTYTLKDATAISKQLREEGLNVSVRRAGAAAGEGAGTFHLVRVGSFPDKARALAARDELGAKGHAGFLTQGEAK